MFQSRRIFLRPPPFQFCSSTLLQTSTSTFSMSASPFAPLSEHPSHHYLNPPNGPIRNARSHAREVRSRAWVMGNVVALSRPSLTEKGTTKKFLYPGEDEYNRELELNLLPPRPVELDEGVRDDVSSITGHSSAGFDLDVRESCIREISVTHVPRRTMLPSHLLTITVASKPLAPCQSPTAPSTVASRCDSLMAALLGSTMPSPPILRTQHLN